MASGFSQPHPTEEEGSAAREVWDGLFLFTKKKGRDFLFPF